MNKVRQKQLISWLKQQSKIAKYTFRILLLLGIFNGLIIISQAWLLATILQKLIIEHSDKFTLLPYFGLLLLAIFIKSAIAWLKEKVSFFCGARIRQHLRQRVLTQLAAYGPQWINGQPAGSWTTMIFEQIEDMQDYYARYLPQIMIASLIPFMILIAIFPLNWAAGLILFFTAPLIPLFMILVGMGAADANRRNFQALSRLSGNFLDRLRGLDTLRLFDRQDSETNHIGQTSEDFRVRTMDVLKIAFLSSAVLEFFTSVSIAIVAVYFGFSYLGEFHFGNYGLPVSLFTGFFVLLLAPEFFQPLRDLGAFYHAKAQAIGAAESLFSFLEEKQSDANPLNDNGKSLPLPTDPLTIIAHDLLILTRNGKTLAGPLNFRLTHQQRVAIVGQSGAGKSSLFNVLLGFLPYAGSLTVNGIELNQLNSKAWRQHLNWIGQSPILPAQTIRQNILLADPQADPQRLSEVISLAAVNEFTNKLPDGLNTIIGDNAARLSVGQAQRVALARALLQPCQLLLLDEPTASLDAESEYWVMQALQQATYQQLTLFITHKLEQTVDYDEIWVMDNGQIIQSGCYADLTASSGSFLTMLNCRQEAI